MYLPPSWIRPTLELRPRQELRHMANILPDISLDAAGLVTIAEISAIARRTVLTGTSILLDIFVLCPGLHRQQSAPELSGGEFPAAAAMTTGYIFRVENPATVLFLQSMGRTGQLTTLRVSPADTSRNSEPNPKSRRTKRWRKHFSILTTQEDLVSLITYSCAVCLTPTFLIFLIWLRDWWGVFCVLVLILARLFNVIVIRRRCSDMGWKGVPEPGVQGDLLVLLSGDRWVRICGAVTDLKAVTSGHWMRDRTIVEDLMSAFATLLVYVSAVLVCNLSKLGQLLLLGLLIASAGLLFMANATTTTMHMNGRTIRVVGARKEYARRRDMADELVRETNRADWALRLGMIVDMPAESSDVPTVVL